MRTLLAIVLAAASPAMHHTAAGTLLAKDSLLTKADLGKSWTATAATSQQGVTLSCKGYQPSGAGIVETGIATSPKFSFGTAGAGPFIAQQTSVYATTGQANLYWSRAVKTKLLGCVAKSLEAVSAQGVKVSITQQKLLSFTSTLTHHAGYRVGATLTSKNKVNAYLDVLVFGTGRTITVVTITSLQAAPPANFDAVIAHDIGKKLGGPTA